ncbi:MAG: hypothetical protein JW974_03155 [Alphaproteobacteria bacterium]|nr:hypothetical protein [Alphaproteobacteria bacterium]MBN2674906.1 hypothetical protein [Alphaproteobacteria bacterium]
MYIEFTASPIVWCKNKIVNKGDRGNFWFTDKFCKISEEIKDDTIKEICPVTKHIVTNYPNTIIDIQDSGCRKQIDIKIKSFVKKFQHIKSSEQKTENMIKKSRKEICQICWKCKNSREI